jgi:hypothetical protein
MRPLAERFWEKVKPGSSEECWPWLASLATGGYGQIAMGHAHPVHAHRVAWQIANGAIPAGMHVLHTCDNRLCCNPSHLFLGTNDDNIRDRMRKGRSTFGRLNGAYTHPERVTRGEQRWNAKVTEEQVRQMFVLRKQGKLFREIAALFGVKDNTVSRIVAGKRWRHMQ